jgi:hypothetical protein
MDIMTGFYVVVYFTIGWFLADWIVDDEKNREELMMFIFLFWPLLIVMLVGMLVLALAMFIAALLSKLLSLLGLKLASSNKGDKQDGTI